MTLQDAANVAIITGALGILGLIYQIHLAQKQLKADHERSRRERSVDVLLEWAKNMKQHSSLARKIVESLNEEQCRNLYSQESIKLPKKHKSSLVKILNLKDEDVKEENGDIILTEDQASEIRWHVMAFLNMLESVLVAWQYSIVDREIIEHQFAYLFSSEEGHAALKYFRTAAGGEKAFPAIEIFSGHIEEKRRSILKQKANIA